MVKLYHGSNMPIEKIDLNRGRKGKDFGQGFYLSDDYRQALKMANVVVEREGFGTPAISSFLFKKECLTDGSLNVKIFSDYTEEWAAFIVANRTNRSAEPCHSYDIVYGPIANDTVGPQIRLYQKGWLTIEQLMKGLRNVRPTFQYFFGTEKAINTLSLSDR